MYRVVSFASLVSLLAGLSFACADPSNPSAGDPAPEGWSVVEPDVSDLSTFEPDATHSDAQSFDVGTVDWVAPPDTSTADTADRVDPGDAQVEVSDPPDLTTTDGDSPDAGPVAPFTSPGETGPFAVMMHGVTVSGQGASFSGELYVPESSDTRRAVLLLPGFMLDSSDFSSTSKRLATHGFIVLCPSFGDSFLSAIDHADLAAHTSAMIDWLETQSSVASSPLSGRLDGSAFGMSGHSRGGKVALLTAINDPRVEAIYTLDPVDTVGGPFSSTPTPENPSVTPELMGELTIPAGFFGAGKGGDGFQPCAPEAENHEAYYSAANSAPIAYHHVDSGAGHMDVIDSGAPGLCAGGESSAETLKAVQKTLVAFMRAHLSGEADCEPFLDGDSVDPRLTWQSKGP